MNLHNIEFYKLIGELLGHLQALTIGDEIVSVFYKEDEEKIQYTKSNIFNPFAPFQILVIEAKNLLQLPIPLKDYADHINEMWKRLDEQLN